MTSATRIVRAFFAAFDAHDIDGMLALCSDGATLRHIPMSSNEAGSMFDIGTKAWGETFKAFPNVRVAVESLIAEGDRVAAEVVIADRERGFELPQVYVLTLDDGGRISAATVY